MSQLTLSKFRRSYVAKPKTCCTCKKELPPESFYIGRSNKCRSCYKDYYQSKKQINNQFMTPEPKQVVIVVSRENKLIDCGEPDTFLLWLLRDYLSAGHIIRQVTEEEFKLSPLNNQQ